MKHYFGTFAAPGPHHPSLLPPALLAAIPGSSSTHSWEPHGFTIVRLTGEPRLILHTWPEHGLVTLDLYGEANLLPIARDLAQALGWGMLAAEELSRLLPDRPSL